MARPARLSALTALMLLGACRSDPVIDEDILTPPPPPAAAQDTIFDIPLGGTSPTGVAGFLLDAPLQVRARLRDGTPLAGLAVEWQAGGPGRRFPMGETSATSLTDEHGVASMQVNAAFQTGLTLVDARLGNGRMLSIPIQVRARAMQGVAGAGGHWCGLATDGVLHCWGVAPTPGLHRVGEVTPPVAANTTERFRVIRSGGGSFCALSLAGALHCWNNPHFGPAGSATAHLATPQPQPTPAPFQQIVMGIVPATSTFGAMPLCGIEADGTAWCKGTRSGDGTGTNRDSYYRIPGIAFRQLFHANSDVCGTDLDGLAWCWGSNVVIGTGNSGTTLAPVRVGGARHYEMVALAGDGTCGIEAGSRELYCWGRFNGPLAGRASVNTVVTEPLPIADGGIRALAIDSDMGTVIRIVEQDTGRLLREPFLPNGPFAGDSRFQQVTAIVTVGSGYRCYRVVATNGTIACEGGWSHGNTPHGIPFP